MGFYPARSAVQKSLGFETATRSPTTLQHYAVTFVLFFVTLAFGATLTRLGKVYQVVGGFASTYLAYIFPGLAYLGVYHPQRLAFFTRRGAEAEPFVRAARDTEPTWWFDTTAVILVVFGVVVMVLATYGALVS
ncbi:hypothetical protein BC937DRAFT_90665 [Endogone sp. FLAS-F59071]|nr:hypothetical protein BC937DRAFT_90665 [Endogone sp. FLAS-F59071]|eukprot:RUS16905.1 hypothetical protein BC937DRAFT_90665 [Endogone sp. FLAS-F59071]